MTWLTPLSRLPLPLLYLLCRCASVLALHVLRLRRRIVMENLGACFPGSSRTVLRGLASDHYRQVGETIAETIRAARISETELRSRVRIVNIELPRRLLGEGRPILLLAAHQANWEWALQAIALELGYPLDVGYKPIKNASVDRAMTRIRGRFGAHLVPAKDLLPDLLQRRHLTRGIAMLADQAPATTERPHWLDFLGRETGFYTGPEQMARAMRYAAVFVALRRLGRGRYEAEFKPLASAGESLPPGEFTRRYAALVEQEIRAAPSDWTWGHRRWKREPGSPPRRRALPSV